ncbi:FAD:protein FMN transferase [Skermania sp. ID1734]|uniref:FAD:protein FMN transferase n=1 Tax=Skermania sp. ID1734 TaxID=2597516 RepID=UPI00117C9A82|nr:FAD:protein FMN transferase [Skermania sp. ID1734]TSE00105.1 FAD:protein FMN transferase [Skermania sp. ID1734]
MNERVAARSWVEHIMGMPVSVHVRADNPGRGDIAEAVASVFADLRRADRIFSTWRPDSDVMRWRRGDLALYAADPWFTEVQALCRVAETATSGLFTTDLLGPDGSRGFDPTGLVKGWAVGRASAHLRAVDRISFSVNAAGDIICGLGVNSAQLAAPWRIGIEDPADPKQIARVVSIATGAIATSGSYARGGHIIDPRSGRSVSRAYSVTVTGPELMWADIWATVAFVEPSALRVRPEWDAYTLAVTPARLDASA